MEIKTAYGINDLVQFKYQRTPGQANAIAAFEVIEIHTATCSAGTQNFYECRPISFHYDMKLDHETKTKDGLPQRTKFIKDVGFAMMADKVYTRFREDELRPCPKEVADQINNVQKPESGQ